MPQGHDTDSDSMLPPPSPRRSRHPAVPSLSDATALLGAELPVLAGTPASDSEVSAAGGPEVVTKLSATPRGTHLAALTVSPTGSTYASLSPSSSLLPLAGSGDVPEAGGGRVCVDGDGSTVGSGGAACVASLDFGGRAGPRPVSLDRAASRGLSRLWSKSERLDGTKADAGALDGQSPVGPTLLAVGYSDGYVTVHSVDDGEERGSAKLVGATHQPVGDDSKAASDGVVAISFLPPAAELVASGYGTRGGVRSGKTSHGKGKVKEKGEKPLETEPPIRLVAVTGSGELALLDLTEPTPKSESSVDRTTGKGGGSTVPVQLPRDSSRLSARSDETQRSDDVLASYSSSSSSSGAIKSLPPVIAVTSVTPLPALSGERPTGALAVGGSGPNGSGGGRCPYVAVGMDEGTVLIFRPAPAASSDGGEQQSGTEEAGCVLIHRVVLPSAALSLDFCSPGKTTAGYGDGPVVLSAGLRDGEVALLDATSPYGLDDLDGGRPSFRPFYFIEAEAPVVVSDKTDAANPITSVVSHRDWTCQAAGRLLLAIAAGCVLRVVDGSTFEVFYRCDFGSGANINDVAFATDVDGHPRIVVPRDDGIVELVSLRCWGLLLGGSDFLKLHEKFHPPVQSHFLKRSSTGKLYNDDTVSALTFAGNGLVAGCGKNVLLYDTSTWISVNNAPHASCVSAASTLQFGVDDGDVVTRIVYSLDGNFMAVAVQKEGGESHLCMYTKAANGKGKGVFSRPEQCKYPSPITTLEFSPDSQFLLIGTSYACVVYKTDESKGIVDTCTRNFSNGRRCAAFSRDGTVIAVGSGSKAVLYDVTSFAEIVSLDIGVAQITSINFNASSTMLAIGRSDNHISLAIAKEGSAWEIERTIAHKSDVALVEFSPDPLSSFLLTIGSGKKCYIYSTLSSVIVQEIEAEGPLHSASFHSSGKMLAIAGDAATTSEALKGEIVVIRVGEVLNPDWYPLLLSDDAISPEAVCQKLNRLTGEERAQFLYHNSFVAKHPNDEPAFILERRIRSALEKRKNIAQRKVLGSVMSGALPQREEVTTYLREILTQFPRAIFATRGKYGSIFEIAFQRDDPRLLKLAFSTALVTCRAHSQLIMNDDMRGGCLTKLLALTCDKYHDVAVGIVRSLVLWPIPSLSSLEMWKVHAGEPVYNVGHSPAAEDVFGEDLKIEFGALARPMVLPIPGLVSDSFLTALTSNCPAEVFNHEELGLALNEIWFNYIRRIFLLDFYAYIVFFAAWSILVTRANAVNPIDATVCGADLDKHTAAVWVAVFILNTAFGVRELRQLRSTADWLHTDGLYDTIRETMESATQAVVETGTSIWQQVYQSKWAGVSRRISQHTDDWWNTVDIMTWWMVNASLALFLQRESSLTVELSVVTSFLVLLKLLSYLRGFNDCGWLLVVLYAQFQGARGFIVVIGTILLGFAVMFLILLGPYNEDFATFGASLFAMFDIGIVGDFDRSLLKESQNPILALTLFLILLIVVFIVSMSGFVLVLEGSLEEVKENEIANRRYQRSRMVIDYLKLLDHKSRAKVLSTRKYFFGLVPVDHEDVIAAEDASKAFLSKKKQRLLLRAKMKESLVPEAEKSQDIKDEIKTVQLALHELMDRLDRLESSGPAQPNG